MGTTMNARWFKKILLGKKKEHAVWFDRSAVDNGDAIKAVCGRKKIKFGSFDYATITCKRCKTWLRKNR